MNVLCRNIAARKGERLVPQRHRPRLKRYTIVCSWCKASAIKLYPSRAAVRDQLSPYRFCSEPCQRRHWEARRKAEWSASPYPCKQCGATITPQQAAGRPRSYCTDACKQAAARERLRRHPAGAVVVARQTFDEAWRGATRAVKVWGEFYDHGAPVEAAYNQAVPVYQAATTDEAQKASIQPIRDAIEGLDGPPSHDEPDRYRAAHGRWQEWWEWWQDGCSLRWSAYEHRLDAAKAATEELRKHVRVAARRAETARLRRAGPDTSTAPG